MGTEVRHISVNSSSIAYRLRVGLAPTLVFLPGYASDMEGTKAQALDRLAAERNLAMLRLDYSGTGASSGRFEDGTLGKWLGEALACIDALSAGNLLLIGSSMGAWVAFHLARLRPERVQALVGIAVAPDFTDWGFTDVEKAEARRRGFLEKANPYGPEPGIFTSAFLESGADFLMLNGGIDVNCRVRLVHGDNDEEVPLEVAFRTMKCLRSGDVQLQVVKGGGHRLSRPHEIDAIVGTVANLLELAR